MCRKFDNSTDLVICTGFPTSCEVKYDILVKKLINNRFKQPCVAYNGTNRKLTNILLSTLYHIQQKWKLLVDFSINSHNFEIYFPN